MKDLPPIDLSALDRMADWSGMLAALRNAYFVGRELAPATIYRFTP